MDLVSTLFSENFVEKICIANDEVVAYFTISFQNVVIFTQGGYFRNFLPLRFYVKSILQNLEVLKLPLLQLQRF